jgi:hypothetical protein
VAAHVVGIDLWRASTCAAVRSSSRGFTGGRVGALGARLLLSPLLSALLGVLLTPCRHTPSSRATFVQPARAPPCRGARDSPP